MPTIFISYRRDETTKEANWIREAMVAAYGARNVALDTHSIIVGQDFRLAINQLLGSSRVVLVVIGSKWLRHLSRRSGDTDYVLTEIESALRKGIHIIPVLVNGASMPSAGELPPSIREMAYRNAVKLGGFWSGDSDLAELVSKVRPWAATVSNTAGKVLQVIVGLIVILIIIAIVLHH